MTLTDEDLRKTIERLDAEQAVIDDEALEREYSRKAMGHFGRIIRRGRVLDQSELGARLDDAVDRGDISEDERFAILNTDIVLEGSRADDRSEVYVLIEVSSAIDAHDLARVVERSRMLAKLGRAVIPALAGHSILREAELAARSYGVWRVLDGRTLTPEDAA